MPLKNNTEKEGNMITILHHITRDGRVRFALNLRNFPSVPTALDYFGFEPTSKIEIISGYIPARSLSEGTWFAYV